MMKSQIFFFIFIFYSSFCFSGDAAPVLFFIGTRPEAIKVLPVQKAFMRENIPTLLCSTGQHKDLISPVLNLFEVEPDFELNIGKPNQTLNYITESVIQKSDEIIQGVKPSLVVVQGDTTSAMAAALSAFHHKIPVAHLEAGLRTRNLNSPFPEEMNRRMISLIALYHFAPNQIAADELLKEGIAPENIFCVGNTVKDALLLTLQKINEKRVKPSDFLVRLIDEQKTAGKKLLLLTAHRRESFNGGIEEIFNVVKQALKKYPDLFIIYPSHPNPYVQRAIQDSSLFAENHIAIIDPLPYTDMVYLISQADGILTDSGGIQEEGGILNIRSLVLREETERLEEIESGTSILIGKDRSKIIEFLPLLLEQSRVRQEDYSYESSVSKKITDVILQTRVTTSTF